MTGHGSLSGYGDIPEVKEGWCDSQLGPSYAYWQLSIRLASHDWPIGDPAETLEQNFKYEEWGGLLHLG